MTDHQLTPNSWASVADVARGVLGNPNRGCRDCGTVLRHHTVAGDVFTPAVECCAPALQRQIKWRLEDIEGVNKQITAREKAIEQIEAEVENAQSRGQTAAAEMRLSRARTRLNQMMAGEYTRVLRELSGEVARLRRKLDEKTRLQ